MHNVSCSYLYWMILLLASVNPRGVLRYIIVMGRYKDLFGVWNLWSVRNFVVTFLGWKILVRTFRGIMYRKKGLLGASFSLMAFWGQLTIWPHLSLPWGVNQPWMLLYWVIYLMEQIIYKLCSVVNKPCLKLISLTIELTLHTCCKYHLASCEQILGSLNSN